MLAQPRRLLGRQHRAVRQRVGSQFGELPAQFLQRPLECREVLACEPGEVATRLPQGQLRRMGCGAEPVGDALDHLLEQGLAPVGIRGAQRRAGAFERCADDLRRTLPCLQRVLRGGCHERRDPLPHVALGAHRGLDLFPQPTCCIHGVLLVQDRGSLPAHPEARPVAESCHGPKGHGIVGP